ncbi:MAG: hypothetical protein B7Y61_03115 [Rhizobiales bacterium 35-66-30]|nr:MAG: hypothetical protein B7Y95_18970 [Rhizobiales bacterium 32-66-11]OYY88266.1 MAG: hypothetical protein B7Y61_03115 [Rhizobiales bacterium 35-66-30]
METSWESTGATGVRHLEADLQALADFLPAFRHSEFKAGEWVGGDKAESGVIEMPYVSYAPVAHAFYKAVYEHGWIRNFDWSAWGKSDEGELLRKTKLPFAVPRLSSLQTS